MASASDRTNSRRAAAGKIISRRRGGVVTTRVWNHLNATEPFTSTASITEATKRIGPWPGIALTELKLEEVRDGGMGLGENVDGDLR